ncbi:Ca2+-dependent phosphoinositide-specific phospholipase C [Rhodococcus maanshanensis]|uniref:Ca2+-dependent phosphoinositide-specific phospholipase C n=1 Tax=Rhodococcus maanshanensis TaxID=183556 RepID=UPI0022B391A2|nr:Ca2+-dependent phosphoinositide-specific phospholipase C [Rhodococcus maanshanensis]MCZ4556094.1 Ca2+-dependent phosphoinositide-specific phospholipase C [Rhodococcus maanshanensis]
MAICSLFAGVAIPNAAADPPYPLDKTLRMNQIQTMATHNSYKPGLIPQGLPPSMADRFPGATIEQLQAGLDYGHKTLTEQINNLGVRSVELDVHADTEGGFYTETPGLAEVGAPTRMDDPAWEKPGLKVFHVGQIDQRTTCVQFAQCLGELKQWSDQNPNHLPFMVLVEFKDTDPLGGEATPPREWGPADYDRVDAEIRSVIPKNKLVTPDDVQGKFPTLEAAVKANAWPTLDKSRGKFMFVNCNCVAPNDRQRLDYLRPDGSLKDRVLFPTSKPGNPDAAVVLADNPQDGKAIQELVKAGYMVRTRSDENTVEARRNDMTRANAAFASGAQWVSTDYPEPDPGRTNTPFQVDVPGGTPARCNPVNAPAACTSLDIENPDRLSHGNGGQGSVGGGSSVFGS